MPSNQAKPPKQSYLVMTAIGKDRPGIVDELTRSVLDHGCNIVDSRMTVLGGEFAMLLMVEGNWNTLAKLESALPELQERLGLIISRDRTEDREAEVQLMPYAVEVVALDHPGIVHNLARFFSQRAINIENMVTNGYAAAHTGTPMFSVSMTIGIPSDVHIASLREEFMDFCDTMNLDAVLEPVKH